jgi:hypothetical protein
MSMRCDTSRASWLSSPHTGLLTWLPVALRRTPCLQRWWPRSEDLRLHSSSPLLAVRE